MSWSGGTYTKGNNGTGGWVGDAALGIGIEAGRHDTQDNDFATGINNCLAKDGQNSMTNNLNFGGYRPSNIAAGDAAAPAICAGNDVNTGMYSPGADQIGFATNGVERVKIISDGRAGIGLGGDASSEGVSGSSTTALTVKGTNTYAQQVMITREASTTGSLIHLCKSRGTTAGSFTVPNQSDFYGEVSFRGGTGSAFVAAVRISAQADDIPSATSMPGLLRFWTTPAGSTTPQSRLQINNQGRVSINNTATTAQLLVFNTDAALPTARFQNSAAGDLAQPAVDIIKTDNNSTTSQVFQQFYINAGTNCGRINANGANNAAFGATCDARLKENIVDLPSQLDAILSLRPVEFDYKDGSGHQIGFIAQEVQEVFPDLIGEADGYLTLTDLNKNDARMIKAFQELAVKVEALEAKVQALEAATEV